MLVILKEEEEEEKEGTALFRIDRGSSEQEASMEVEVDLFSGQPNPRFRLTPEAAAELSRRIARLPPAPVGAAASEGLGYRGFRPTAEEQADQFAEIVVSNGVVLVRDQRGQERALADPDRSLECWLAELGAPSLDPGVTAVLRQQLSGESA